MIMRSCEYVEMKRKLQNTKKKMIGLLSQMLLKAAETNNKLTFLMSCNFFSKNFQVTKFCEGAQVIGS